MDTEEKIQFLEELSGYEGTECGEMWSWLYNLYRYKDSYLFDEDFKSSMDKEIEKQFDSAMEMIEEGSLEDVNELLEKYSISVNVPTTPVEDKILTMYFSGDNVWVACNPHFGISVLAKTEKEAIEEVKRAIKTHKVNNFEKYDYGE
jgi:hypothetical protein